MKVFISYSSKEEPLADRVVAAVQQASIETWYGKREIMPGDNWGEKIGQGLKECDAMVLLLSRDTLQSSRVRWDLEYALGERAYSNRLITVLAGQPDQLPSESLPWILRRLKIVRLSEPEATSEEFGKIAEALREVA
jgi:hypothetical protein